MSIRPTLLLASAALVSFASPALAQDDRYGSVAEDAAIEWQEREVIQPLGEEYEERAHGAMRAMPAGHHGGEEARSAAPRLAYSMDERDAWLADCRIAMRSEEFYYDDDRYEDDADDGGLLGGLLGAVVGGVAGNRIAGAGDRLAGTLIGAGVGGIAGAVIGSAIGRDDGGDDYGPRYDREAEEAWAADYCAAYLRRYEASGQAGYGQMAYAQVQPVMLVSTGSRHGAVREIVREEWVEEAAPVIVEHRRQRRTAQRREPGKLTAVD